MKTTLSFRDLYISWQRSQDIRDMLMRMGICRRKVTMTETEKGELTETHKKGWYILWGHRKGVDKQ
jgi:hypothetical protein